MERYKSKVDFRTVVSSRIRELFDEGGFDHHAVTVFGEMARLGFVLNKHDILSDLMAYDGDPSDFDDFLSECEYLLAAGRLMASGLLSMEETSQLIAHLDMLVAKSHSFNLRGKVALSNVLGHFEFFSKQITHPSTFAGANFEESGWNLFNELPSEVAFVKHSHFLIKSPLYLDSSADEFEYECDVCGEPGAGCRYECSDGCDFTCHCLCVLRCIPLQDGKHSWLPRGRSELYMMSFWDDDWLQTALRGGGLGTLRSIYELPDISSGTMDFIQYSLDLPGNIRPNTHDPVELFPCRDCGHTYHLRRKDIVKGSPKWPICRSCQNIRLHLFGKGDEEIKCKLCPTRIPFNTQQKRYFSSKALQKPSVCSVCKEKRNRKGSGSSRETKSEGKSKPCFAYQNGKCRFGSNCHFEHHVVGPTSGYEGKKFSGVTAKK